VRVVTLDGLGAVDPTNVIGSKGTIADMDFSLEEAEAASEAALQRAQRAAQAAPITPQVFVAEPISTVSEAQLWGWRIALYAGMAGMAYVTAVVARKAF
jgi:hypothetical protein